MKKMLLLVSLLLASGFAKTVTVGTGRMYSKVSDAVNGSLPLVEDLYVLVYAPSGSYSTADGVNATTTSGLNGYKVIIKGLVNVPSVTAYIEDESVDEWDGNEFLERYDNLKGVSGVEARVEGAYLSSGATKTIYYAKDHLGSTREAVSVDNQSDLESNGYFSYGNLTSILSSADPTKEKFTGKELDIELGYYYFGARYYNADLSVWISPDPMHQYIGLYSYCGENPSNCMDRDGNLGAFAGHSATAAAGLGDFFGAGYTYQSGQGAFLGGGELSVGSYNLSTGFAGPGDGNSVLGASAGCCWSFGLTTANNAENFAGIAHVKSIDIGFEYQLSIQIGYGGQTGDLSAGVSFGPGGGLSISRWNTENTVGKTTWSSNGPPVRLPNFVSNNAADASSVSSAPHLDQQSAEPAQDATLQAN